MKSNSKWLACMALVFGMTAHGAHAETLVGTTEDGPSPSNEKIEVLVGNLFVPRTGYDNNDNIQFTVDGFLPNSCYQIAETQVERSRDPNTLVVHQFAYRRLDGVCAEDSSVPIQMRSLVPYTLNVSLGKMATGAYTLLFDPASGFRKSQFNVERAKSPSADDHVYGAVTSIQIPDVVNGARDITATLSGLLSSSCQFVQSVRVQPDPINHTIVVLPILGFREHVLCSQVMLPFESEIQLGNLAEGRYLLHVRSMNGKAVTRVFSVVRPDPS